MGEVGERPLCAVGQRMLGLVRELYPVCRSITGEGVRTTLRRLAREVPLELVEVPSGTPVLDWVVPDEWNVREAWIADAQGKRVVDFRDHSLHLVSYSRPVRTRLSLGALRPHLHTLPDHPDWIPYRTSYYADAWGFCLTQRQLDALPEGEYEVCVDTRLAPGHLTYGELFLPGEAPEEILISAHVCHPSLCNDNLSGVAVAVELARALADARRRRGVRFLFIPGTIGSLTWLARNREAAARVAGGLSLVCLGDAAPLTYKRTFSGVAEIDRVAERVLAERGEPFGAIDFHPYGYDERQFNAPGFRMPVGSLMRGRHGEFPEYHTSADDPDFVSAGQLQAAFEACRAILAAFDGGRRYRSLAPEGEPQLGRRGIYGALGGVSSPGEVQVAMLWILTCGDGQHRLEDVARRAGLSSTLVDRAAVLLREHGLIEEMD